MLVGRGSTWVGVAAAAAVVLLPAGGAFGAPGSKTPKPPKPPTVTIGVLLPSQSNPIFAAIQKGIEQSRATYGFKANYNFAKHGNSGDQISAIRQLILQKVTAIAIVPADPGAVSPAIDAAVAAGIPVATLYADATSSRRSFFYGPSAAAEGKAQAQHVLASLHALHRRGVVEYAVSSCLPKASAQVARRNAFAAVVRANPYAKEFQLKALGVFDTGTVPATSLIRVRKQLAAHPGVDVVYATCAPDTVNWGIVLRQRKNRTVLVAGHEWSPAVFTLISQGWIRWSLGQSPYNTGLTSTKLLYLHASLGSALPHGVVPALSVFATKATLAQIRAGVDYPAAVS